MSLHYLSEITNGVLLSRVGEVHKNRGRITECGTRMPDRYATVSTVQAIVHKLSLCHGCFPAHHRDGGRRG